MLGPPRRAGGGAVGCEVGRARQHNSRDQSDATSSNATPHATPHATARDVPRDAPTRQRATFHATPHATARDVPRDTSESAKPALHSIPRKVMSYTLVNVIPEADVLASLVLVRLRGLGVNRGRVKLSPPNRSR